MKNLLKSLFVACLVYCLVIGISVSCNAQINSNVKAITFSNADSATVKSMVSALQTYYGNIGSLYYNKQSSKFRIFYDSGWHDLIQDTTGGSISGLTPPKIPYATSSSTLGNSGVSYSTYPQSLSPSTQLFNITGLNGNIPPVQFYNHGYLTGTDTTVFPNNHLIRVPKGFVAINWSQNIVNNWQWNNALSRAEPVNTNIPMNGFEVGGEGILSHYTAPAAIPATSFHEITRFGGGVDGVNGINPYSTFIPFNQFKSPIFFKWASTTTPPVGTTESWWGGTNNALSGRLNPEIWGMREESKSVSTNDYFNEDIRLDGFGTFMGINFARSNGTYQTKTASAGNQQHGVIGGIGYDGTNYQKTAAIEFVTRGTVSAGVVPMSIMLRTSETNTAGLTNRIEIAPNGNAGFGIIGSLSQTAKVHIAAGSTTAGTAPIKLTSGSLMTTPEVGAIEFLTDKLYSTITTGTARKEITLNDAALTNGTFPVATTNGRLTDSGLSVSGGVITTNNIVNHNGANAAIQLNGSAGSAGQVLTSAGAGLTPTWSAASSGTVTSVSITAGTNITQSGSPITGSGAITVNAVPSGSTTEIQFNNAGAFGASANLAWDNTNNIVTVTNSGGSTQATGLFGGNAAFTTALAGVNTSYAHQGITMSGTAATLTFTGNTTSPTSTFTFRNGTGGATNIIVMSNLPTACTGLSTGTLWNDTGTLKICP